MNPAQDMQEKNRITIKGRPLVNTFFFEVNYYSQRSKRRCLKIKLRVDKRGKIRISNDTDSDFSYGTNSTFGAKRFLHRPST